MLKANYEHTTCFGVVEKLSGLGYKFNKRLLCLHDGILSYYSKIPADAATGNMNQSTLKKLNLKPKLSIEIKYIKAIKLADKNLRKKRDFVFVVEFTKAAFMTGNRKDSADLKSDQELQWIFAVNDEESFKKWTSLLEQVRSEQDSSSQNSSFAIEDKLQKENSLNLEGVLHERNKEEEFRRKQEGEEKLKIEWEYNYNLLMNENMKALSIEDRVKTGFQLLRFIGKFRTEAVNLCKDIIDELSLSRSEQKFSAFEKTDLDQNSKKSQRIFIVGEIIVRMTWTERERVDPDDDGSSRYLYTDKVAKSYNHEFRAMDILNDILYELNKNRQDVAYRVPLAVRVDYKGFKCLMISNPPMESDETLQLGPRRSKGTYRANKSIDKDLKYIAKVLNLKEHTFVLDDKVTKINVPLSVLTEIHKVTFAYHEDDIRSSRFNEARLTFNGPRGHECFYFMKTADIFPVDIDLETKKNPSFLKRLRPEFLYEYERPLSADALVNTTGDNSNYEDDDVEVAEAGIYLRTAIVPDFVKKLNSMEIIMTDSTSWTEALHCHGINMRYMGLICQQTNLPHVKKACITEMIARSVKKILSKEISDIVLHSSKRSRIFVRARNSSGSKGDEPRKSERKKSQEVAETEEDIGDCVIEVLNLIFGKGEESTQFWSETMTNQIMHDFGYDIKDVQKTDISLGGLLLAVVHHCNTNIKWDSSIEELLDKVPNPFNKSCYEGVKAKSKVYSMQNLEVKSSGERYKTAKLSQEYDVAINSCLLARSIDEHMAVKGESSKDPGLLGDMAEIYYETEQFDKAYEHAKEGLKYSRTLHVEAVKCLCVMMRVQMIKNEKDSALKHFEQAIKHLNFHVGLYHPMHAQIYNIFGSYYGQLAPKRY